MNLVVFIRILYIYIYIYVYINKQIWNTLVYLGRLWVSEHAVYSNILENRKIIGTRSRRKKKKTIKRRKGEEGNNSNNNNKKDFLFEGWDIKWNFSVVEFLNLMKYTLEYYLKLSRKSGRSNTWRWIDTVVNKIFVTSVIKLKHNFTSVNIYDCAMTLGREKAGTAHKVLPTFPFRQHRVAILNDIIDSGNVNLLCK
jgi:hypothetical protein